MVATAARTKLIQTESQYQSASEFETKLETALNEVRPRAKDGKIEVHYDHCYVPSECDSYPTYRYTALLIWTE